MLACGERGGGFAYTMGIASRGMHELHMWDRPTHGDDPGADFSLSSSDLGHILNWLADEWVTDRLRIGDVREISLDEGLAKAMVTLEEPVEAESVEALGARPSLVVPLAWSLHRPPRGEPVEIMADAREAYGRDIRGTAEKCDARVAVSGARLPAGPIDFSVHGPYGPLSALVEAHARAIAGVADVDVLISNALAVEEVMNPGALMARMSALSRLSGRDEQVEQVQWLVDRVADRLSKRRAWRNTVTEMARVCDLGLASTQANLDDLVRQLATCALTGLALDDVLPDDLVLASQGPWRAVMSSTGADPGQRWRCSEEAEQAIRRAFAALDGFGLRHVVQSMIGPVSELLGQDLMRAQGLALTRAVAPPEVTEIVLTPHQARILSPLMVQQLSLLAQLMAVVIDAELELDDDRAGELEAILGWPIDVDWWSAA